MFIAKIREAAPDALPNGEVVHLICCDACGHLQGSLDLTLTYYSAETGDVYHFCNTVCGLKKFGGGP